MDRFWYYDAGPGFAVCGWFGLFSQRERNTRKQKMLAPQETHMTAQIWRYLTLTRTHTHTQLWWENIPKIGTKFGHQKMTCRPDTATSPDPALGLLETFVGAKNFRKPAPWSAAPAKLLFHLEKLVERSWKMALSNCQNDVGLARTLDLENLMKKWGLSIKDGDLTIKNGGLRGI